jgi:hypothetical protein
MTFDIKYRYLFTILLFCILQHLNAQENVQKGKLEIVQDPRISTLLEKHVQLNAVLPGVMDGYRIQIFFDSGNESKKRAVDIRTDFIGRFPGISAYLSFQEPFFKIRTGDFRSKLEADGFLQKILPVYPNAYIVRDRINYPKTEVQ